MKISPVTLQNGTNFKAKKQNKRLKDTVPKILCDKIFMLKDFW